MKSFKEITAKPRDQLKNESTASTMSAIGKKKGILKKILRYLKGYRH